MAMSDGDDPFDAREMGLVSYKAHKGKTDMLRWSKRYLVASRETAELQFYKNDQALTPKHVAAVRDIVSLHPSKRGQMLEVHCRGSTPGFSLKMRTQEIRDMWLAKIRQMMEDPAAQVAHVRATEKDIRIRPLIEEWKAQFAALGYDVRVTVDEPSFAAEPNGRLCLSAVLDGQWVGSVVEVLKDLASGTHVVHPLSRIVVRYLPRGSGKRRTAAFDKTTGVLVLRGMWAAGGETDGRRASVGQAPTPRGHLMMPDAGMILPLLITKAWQRGIDEALEQSPQWIDAVRRLHRQLGKDVPVALDWDADLQEDTPELRHYVESWVNPGYLAAVTKAIAAATAQRAASELEFWLGGVSLYIEPKRLTASLPPIVRVHRVASRAEEDGGLSRAMVNLFNKCRGEAHDSAYSGIVCQGTAKDLTQALSDTMSHMSMVLLIRTAEKITVGGADTDDQIDFVVNWDSFLATMMELDIPPKARLKLARALLSQYPGRVESVTKALSRGDWGTLCGTLTRFTVLFVDVASTKRGGVEERDILDVCVIDRSAKPGGGESLRLHFDIKDLGSFCRGLLSGLPAGLDPLREEISSTTYPPLGTGPGRVRSRSSFAPMVESEREDGDGYSGSSASDYGEARLMNMSMVSRSSVGRPYSESPPGRRAPTQYADDSAPLNDCTLPQLLVRELQGTDLDDVYPVKAALVADIVDALNRTFSDRGTIEPQDKQLIIRQAILKLRQIFHRHDPDKQGVISHVHLQEIIDKFQEFHPSGRANDGAAKHLAAKITKGGETAEWQAVATTLMTALFPKDVKQCMMHKRHCLLLGLESTGKTTMVSALKGKEYTENAPTLGHREDIVEVDDMMLSICEVGGGEEQVQNWSLYSKQADTTHGIIFMVDAAKPASFDHARGYLKDVLQSRHIRRVPLLLLVNNVPSRDPRAEVAIAASLKLEKYCKHGKRPYKVLAGTFTSPMATDTQLELHKALLWLVCVSEESKAQRE